MKMRSLSQTELQPEVGCSSPAAGSLTASTLFALVYAELREIAVMRLASERRGHTLSPSALVHEVFLRLGSRPGKPFVDRVHFLATASAAMRHVLIDYARARRSGKRYGGLRVTLDEKLRISFDQRIEDVVSVHEALTRLEEYDGELASIVEMRFFAGLTEREIAVVLGRSERHVGKRWKFARAWLFRALDSVPASPRA